MIFIFLIISLATCLVEVPSFYGCKCTLNGERKPVIDNPVFIAKKIYVSSLKPLVDDNLTVQMIGNLTSKITGSEASFGLLEAIVRLKGTDPDSDPVKRIGKNFCTETSLTPGCGTAGDQTGTVDERVPPEVFANKWYTVSVQYAYQSVCKSCTEFEMQIGASMKFNVAVTILVSVFFFMLD